MRMVDGAGVRRADGRRVRRLQGPAVELLGAEFGLRFLVDPDRPVSREFQATAVAPFSQNSARRNPGSNPPPRIALSSRNAFATACNAPQPPAGASLG